MERIIGRKEEKRLLEKLYRSPKAEFLAIYGRRRIGKTFLVSTFFRDLGVYFEITGSKYANKTEQLNNFHLEFVALFKPEKTYAAPKSWSEAFYRLKDEVCRIQPPQKVILFFDELPWLASAKSGFLSALEYFWNRHGSRMPNLLLIVCGSAASWMIKKVIHNKGGLYGRLSAEMRLHPFSLSEVEQFFQAHQVHLTHKQIVEIYMATGGVPKYLADIERGKSSAQIIHSLCFTPQGQLLMEFHKLYDSLFENADKHVKIIRALADKKQGMPLKELLKTAGLAFSGRSMEIVAELEESGFIACRPAFGKEAKEYKVQLIDEYSLFYLTWIDPVKQSVLQGTDPDYWIRMQATGAWHAWAGHVFETICLKHVGKIKSALEIGGLSTRESHWRYTPLKKAQKEGAEIDLVIDRADQCINLCEIRFVGGLYTMTKTDADDLQRKKRAFQEQTKTKKAVFITLITPYGAQENEHFLSCVDKQLTLDALF